MPLQNLYPLNRFLYISFITFPLLLFLDLVIMSELLMNRVSKAKQCLFSLLLVSTVSILCFSISSIIGYKVVAFIFLVTVSIIAISFDILPVLIAAVLSALIWNFFFIPPRFTFHVGTTDNLILFVMYFIIALLNAVLTN